MSVKTGQGHTHQGSVEEVRQGSYLNVFVFRFNRRREASERLAYYRVLELAVGRDPVRYRKLVANPGPKKIPPSPPDAQGHPRAWTGPRAAATASALTCTGPLRWIPLRHPIVQLPDPGFRSLVLGAIIASAISVATLALKTG